MERQGKCVNKTKSFTPASVKNYRIHDAFWVSKMEMVRTEMIPYQWKALNDQLKNTIPSHCIKNFKIAAGMEEGEFYGYVFQDSDLAKWLEAVGYTLAWHKDSELEKTADEIIEIVEKAQQEDGYLDTYYIINGMEKRWTNLADNHELYCAGHMIEAGVAYYQGTGKKKLLNIVKRFADCIDKSFGPEEGKLHAYPGHEIIEMALVRLYHVTGEERYLNLAAYFINERGRTPLYFEEEQKKNGNVFHWENSLFQYQYYQAGKPVREQEVAEGHAVRAVYLYSGMTSVAKELQDESLLKAVKRLWLDVTRKQMYITGAIGSSDYGEAFTFGYDLPNDEVYGETCASIGLVFWARRMLEMELDSDYADVMERALYNGCISGMSKDGTRFFYVNPLEVDPEACRKDQRKKHVAVERQKWFGCACCPPNLARLIASVGNYACSFGERMAAFHLYIGGEIEAPFDGVRIRVDSRLPWSGNVCLTVEGEARYTLALRIPGWRGSYKVCVNGEPFTKEPEKGYLYIERDFRTGDRIEMEFDMPPRKNYAHPGVKADLGKVALSRGPIIYCLEEADNGAGLSRMSVGRDSEIRELKGTIEEDEIDLEVAGRQLDIEAWKDRLYQYERPEKYKEQTLRYIPYYLWNNRGAGEMTVWVRED